MMILLFLFLTSPIIAQELQKNSTDLTEYSNIREAYYKAFDENEIKRADYYADVYLRKAKKDDKHGLEHIHGHYFKHEVSTWNNALLHLDSIILISTYLIDDPKYPEYAYFLKAGIYFNQEDLKNTLDNYLLALKIAEKKGNEYMIAMCKNSIGILKAERVGQERGALRLFKESLEFYNTLKDKTDYSHDYAVLLFSLSENYRRLNLLDSSSYYNAKGLDFCKEYNLAGMSPYFIYADGVNFFIKGFPKSAIDKLEMTLPELNLPNAIIAHYYLSKSYEELGDMHNKMKHLKALDSLQKGQSIYQVELIKGIEDLRAYYESINDSEKERYYSKRLRYLESIDKSDFKELFETIDKEYDDKKLIDKNEVLQNQLKSSTSSTQKLIYIITFLLLLIVSGFYYFHLRQQKIKRRFELIMNTDVLHNKSSKKARDTKKINISPEIITSVMDKLNKFEHEKGFLQANLTTNILSKIVQTNNKYLSKIIKHSKGKGIVTYINDLRVTHAMERLKNDPTFKTKFTIMAIAEEVGFSNPKSFNKSFDRVFKISAKDFIDELKNREVNSEN